MFRVVCLDVWGDVARQVFEEEHDALMLMFDLCDMGYDSRGLEFSYDGINWQNW